MNNMENMTYDKSLWGKGEWDNEPDRVDFIHVGYSCFIMRNHSGAWCGYVGVPSNHVGYGQDYNEMCEHVDVHGGLTYADKCRGSICHIPEPGMPDDVWWFGFDTAHYNDKVPGMEFYRFYDKDERVYRNMEYTINETKQLAEQLKAME
jgi:hypothetical protein